ncbi:biopolymer transporter ExbD [Pseudosulfitobacter sp. SM2401]|uniref:ExbD/TolR family protein n=1 Tax=Pseudosulfitobacter sp. SM2401 TaxID=3350098 RepID=UPI0036F1B6E9
MKLSRTRRRESPETIIPLIDVVFFLLIFFMLIGRMDATAPFDVTPAIASTGQDMPGGGATISVAADGTLALNGGALDRTGTLDGIKGILANDPRTLIRINAHKSAELQAILPMVAEIQAMGAMDVVLVVTPAAP